MRTLSKSEKQVVKKLCEKHQYFADIFERDFLQDLLIEIISDSIERKYEIKFLVKKPNVELNEYYKRRMYEATEKLVETINLLDYLKNQAYIYSFKTSHSYPVKGYIGQLDMIQYYHDHSDEFVGITYPDDNTYGFIFEYVDKQFASTEALRDYTRKKFRTPEQIRHRQNLWVAWTAIFISIILGLYGIFCS